uniref:Uncharacterized protein n=1 Tax=Trichuris muris TaxID=70415 RepID=A0A5S6QCE6_TRIMR
MEFTAFEWTSPSQLCVAFTAVSARTYPCWPRTSLHNHTDFRLWNVKKYVATRDHSTSTINNDDQATTDGSRSATRQNKRQKLHPLRRIESTRPRRPRRLAPFALPLGLTPSPILTVPLYARATTFEQNISRHFGRRTVRGATGERANAWRSNTASALTGAWWRPKSLSTARTAAPKFWSQPVLLPAGSL